jgi:serine/threonine-protein kinase
MAVTSEPLLKLECAEEDNAQLLARLHNEVRLARQISHPNVCRVYDLGDLDGLPFISMEYIDGEDLKSLIRRIGRLPGDKAIEIARRLCAGLAAAHNKGVLHRDLKPANIMVDGEGQVLITDFGLAAVAGTINGAELHNGTPAYMAREQLEWRDVSVRSDLYSLGLVLFEMFSGKRAFASAGDRSFPSKLSTVTRDIDPAVDRIVQQCLDPNPQNRPSSALAAAEALPFYDPLADALAACETPSPEMVAAGGEAGGLSVRSAFLCFGLVLVGLFSAVRLSNWSNHLLLSVFHSPPAVLAQKARDLMEGFGYAGSPMDQAYGFIYVDEYQEYMEVRHQVPEFKD